MWTDVQLNYAVYDLDSSAEHAPGQLIDAGVSKLGHTKWTSLNYFAIYLKKTNLLTFDVIMSISSVLLSVRISWNRNRLNISEDNQFPVAFMTGGSASAMILNSGCIGNIPLAFSWSLVKLYSFINDSNRSRLISLLPSCNCNSLSCTSLK